MVVPREDHARSQEAVAAAPTMTAPTTAAPTTAAKPAVVAKALQENVDDWDW
jgi:hypothetical protein